MLHTFYPNILDYLSCLNTSVTAPKLQQTYHPHDTAVSLCYVYRHYIQKHCHTKNIPAGPTEENHNEPQ